MPEKCIRQVHQTTSLCKGKRKYKQTFRNMSSGSTFVGENEFCPECGTILPLPGAESTVTCHGCSYKVDVKSKHYQKITFGIT